MIKRLFLGILWLQAAALWSQTAPPGAATANAVMVDSGQNQGQNQDQPMLVPTPVGGESYSMAFTDEEEPNFLRGGLTFQSAYDDNVTGGTTGRPVSDISYSIWPTIALDQTRPRLHWNLLYSPGFTFYQRTSAYNETDQNVSLDLRYRLTPHVQLVLRDAFRKTSNILNQATVDSNTSISGFIQSPNTSIIAPIGDLLSNTATAELSYQFSMNSMVGASGTFTDLHYGSHSDQSGLYDSSARGGSGFYTHRISGKHYVGVTYQYQMLHSYPDSSSPLIGPSETQTNTIDAFYTVVLDPAVSVSFFGGPQHSSTTQFGLPASNSWTPSGGVSVGWRERHTSVAASFSRAVTDGGGLVGAVRSTSAAIAVRQQLTKAWSAGVSANYAENKILEPLAGINNGGHSIYATASVQRQFGENFNAQASYTRIHQSYGNLGVLSAFPDRNREWISVSYQFSRPLGR